MNKCYQLESGFGFGQSSMLLAKFCLPQDVVA